MTAVKGKLFEYLVRQLLLARGFRPVGEDRPLVYRGSAGLMVQGLGQPHNADVLLYPPYQTPFYYPTRLLVECKCYRDSIGLPIVRNALGLREDLNHFEIVTEEMLENRQSPRGRRVKYDTRRRWLYQVAVASVDGFKDTAVAFAQAHRIPLISFAQSSLFEPVRAAMEAVDQAAQADSALKRAILDWLRAQMGGEDRYNLRIAEPVTEDGTWEAFLDEVQALQNRTSIGLLDDGTILFLVKLEPHEAAQNQHRSYEDGCSIHWSSGNLRYWVLRDGNRSYGFELPEEMFRQWQTGEAQKYRDALRLKEDYFSRITLFDPGRTERTPVQILRLSRTFLEEAARNLRNG